MFTEAQNFAIVQTELDSVFYQTFNAESTYPGFATSRTAELFPVVNTTHAAYIYEVYKQPGLFSQITEVQNVPSTVPEVTNKENVDVLDWGKSITISKNLFDDNMHGVWAETVTEFARMARVTQDIYAFGIFRGAFTTTLTPDGVAFISASHPLIGGGTENNLVTGALNPDTLNDAMTRLAEQKAQNGVIRGDTGAVLLVPVKLAKKAREITDSALLADSGNNNLNVYRSAFGFTVWTSPYLGAAAGGSDTAWFLLAKNHAVRRLVRQGIETRLRNWDMSDNRTYLYQANYRESYFVQDYSGAVGSTGV